MLVAIHMTNNYLLYFLTLISSFAVYWVIGVLASVAAGFSAIVSISFLASIIHFGVSSWLFLHIPKVGRMFATVTGLLVALFPATGCVNAILDKDLSYLFMAVPLLLFNLLVVSGHVKALKVNKPLIALPGRILLSVIPFSLSLYALWYMVF